MRLKELRKARKMTQQDVANAIGCTAVVYTRYETGSRQPSIEMLLRLADVFGVTVDYLLDRRDIEDSTLSAYEIELVTAAREADERARLDALNMLKMHTFEESKKDSRE